MIKTKGDNVAIVNTPAEIWVTDEISIKFKEPIHISAKHMSGVTRIIEQASAILRTLEFVKRN